MLNFIHFCNNLLDRGRVITVALVLCLLLLSESQSVRARPGSSSSASEFKDDIHNDTVISPTDKPSLATFGNPSLYGYYTEDEKNPSKIKRTFRIGIISDLDRHSADSSEPAGVMWLSYLKEGNLHLEQDKVNPYRSNISIEWDDVHTIKCGLAYSGRGMELSTLNMFNGRLLSCDDRTGVIYELVRDNSTHEYVPTPWAILANGNYSGTGFKCEWATVKDGDLYVGGNGKDLFGSDGKRILDQKYVKKVSPHGEVSHFDWSDRYTKMEQALNIHAPGFIVHEAAGWSQILKKWVFMPRYVSREEYDAENVRYSGSNVAFVADENFDSVHVEHIGRVKRTKSFSGFKWIPDTDDQLIVALKTVELEDEQETYIMAFDIKGNVIMKEKKVTDQKFEGIEFL